MVKIKETVKQFVDILKACKVEHGKSQQKIVGMLQFVVHIKLYSLLLNKTHYFSPACDITKICGNIVWLTNLCLIMRTYTFSVSYITLQYKW